MIILFDFTCCSVIFCSFFVSQFENQLGRSVRDGAESSYSSSMWVWRAAVLQLRVQIKTPIGTVAITARRCCCCHRPAPAVSKPTGQSVSSPKTIRGEEDSRGIWCRGALPVCRGGISSPPTDSSGRVPSLCFEPGPAVKHDGFR